MTIVLTLVTEPSFTLFCAISPRLRIRITVFPTPAHYTHHFFLCQTGHLCRFGADFDEKRRQNPSFSLMEFHVAHFDSAGFPDSVSFWHNFPSEPISGSTSDRFVGRSPSFGKLLNENYLSRSRCLICAGASVKSGRAAKVRVEMGNVGENGR